MENKWIQDAIKRVGALRSTAKKKGLIRSERDRLSATDFHKLEKMGGRTSKQAYLAQTLGRFDKGGEVKQAWSYTIGGL